MRSTKRPVQKKVSRPVSSRTSKKAVRAVAKLKKVVAKKVATTRKIAAKKTRVYDPTAVKKLAGDFDRWNKQDLAKVKQKTPLRRKEFTTDAGIPIPDVLTAADRKAETVDQLGLPGQFPFTRGVQPRSAHFIP